MDFGVARVRRAGLAYFIAVTPTHPAHGEPAWQIDWRAAVGSTNDELAALVAAGALRDIVVATDNQTAGHGRLGREWTSPPGTGLAMSALVDESRVPVGALPERSALVPLLAGMAVVDTLENHGLRAHLKWPNDVLVNGRKVAGVLCRAIDSRVIVGIGVNTSLREADLPVPTAGSMSMFGVDVGARDLLTDLLKSLTARLKQWREHGDEDLLADYRDMCTSIGMRVRVHMAASEFTADAVGVDDHGALVVVRDGEAITVSAGDVIHLREDA